MSNNKKHKFNFKQILSNIKVSEHFEQQLKARFGKSSDELDFGRFKIGTSSCNIPQVRNKVATADSHKMVAFNTYFNMIVMVDMNTSNAITAMYLDGQDGYNN